MSEERRLDVLRAIVQDYVATSEPVGSKALLDRHQLGVSAATIRNDMAALEEEGLISAPHTSAGRVPTDAGYRRFVDRLGHMKPLSKSERSAIETFLQQAVDLDDVVDRTVRLLSSLTNQVAVMQYPTIGRATVRHLELVSLAEARVMAVMILSTGRVEERILNLEHTEDDLAGLKAAFNELVVGRTRADAADAVVAWADARPVPPADNSTSAQAAHLVADLLAEEREDRLALAGRAHLARSVHDFPGSIGPVLDALEEHVVLLRLIQQMQAEGEDAVFVRIGGENSVQGLRNTSIVSTGYGAGGIGVLGPTRMDYATSMAAVRAVARYVSDLLEQ
ncbi:heat-inducible transcriptional repressor HrcA [Yimella sp. cx-51]|uniref:heat-inducible transcriptional repressor HrcA n=1 Tax=Yimella sp. cx-51 TaxID=2770551 RepID=UPI00165E2129|nr:heat-inducible transcriptional repressor HrcA [Yimella sp. cx-51]MBC9956897.1 heat-inducible transcriptional repressor HrcA [Yimella sp. cx-51]QTH39118.1 heat-inducible transcriptional repressor HrcA [Yimella sp. cx-51]